MNTIISLQKLSAAKLEIAAFDEIGGIKAIRVIDPGSGYDPDEPPDVFISDPEYIEYESPDIGDIASLGQGISDSFQYLNDGIPVGDAGDSADPNKWINTNTGKTSEAHLPHSKVSVLRELAQQRHLIR